MGDKGAKSEGLERLCQAVSPSDEPCDYPATVHYARCGRWFCDAHAEDEEWHSCVLALVMKAARRDHMSIRAQRQIHHVNALEP
jgi:hypothetical protein